MKKVAVCRILLLTLTTMPQAYAQSDAEKIYQSATKKIFDHEQPAQLFIWDKSIPATTFSEQRVPKQNPGEQFHGLKGITPTLELNLLYANLINGLGSNKDNRPLQFNGKIPGVNSISVVGTEKLLTDQAKIKADASNTSLVIGFSNIGFESNTQQKSALLYAEVCLLNSDDACGGEGFIFTLNNGRWTLQDHAFLWQGSSKPFWKISP